MSSNAGVQTRSKKRMESIGDTNGHSKNGILAENNNAGPTKEDVKEEGMLSRFWHYTCAPLLLMTYAPSSIILLWFTCFHCQGSFSTMLGFFYEKGLLSGTTHILSLVKLGTPIAAYIILGYMAWALLLMVLVPGPREEGPLTPTGHTPVYKDNGFSCYVITMVAFVALQFYLQQRGLTTTIVYDHFGEILMTLTVFSHVLVILLMIKGHLFPSTADHGSSGNPIFDYYWGMELYPRILGIDIKVFTNCRFGMTVWPLLVCIFAVKSYELHGFVDSIWLSATLQMIYFTKFFWWEAGYMRTIDIMVDRAGFMICWGCMAYVPGVYAAVSMYLASHPVHLGPVLTCVILFLGTGSILINYQADKQKQDVRAAGGKCDVWGKPAEIMRVKYQMESGEVRSSILLVSGWWAVARHFNYVPELALAFFWTVPALFENLMPYTYLIFLTILLVNRSYRDDDKCRKKYAQYWDEYCKRVPYKMIPGVF